MSTLKQIRKRYSYAVKHGDGWAAYLKVDHQSFCIVEKTTKSTAEWFRKNLSIALQRLIEQQPPSRPMNGGRM